MALDFQELGRHWSSDAPCMDDLGKARRPLKEGEVDDLHLGPP